MERMRIGAWVIAAALLCAAGAAAEDRGTQVARQHFQKGQRLYEVAKFQEALEAFTAAYETKPLYDFLFNIGQCHRRLGNHDSALFFYRGFLSHLPETAERRGDRQEVERLIGEVEAAKAAQAVAAEEAARQEEMRRKMALEPDSSHAVQPTFADDQAPAGEVARPVYKRPLFWGLVGVAAAAVAAAAVLVAVLSGATQLPMGKLGTIDDRL
jgi:tetratricopeptide (TPR) repeat protein